MGLFNIFKHKENQNSTNEAEKAAPPASTPAPEHKPVLEPEPAFEPENVGPFTLLVEDSFQQEDDQGVMVVGQVYGTIHTGEQVFLIRPNGTVINTIIDKIKLQEQAVPICADERACLLFKNINDEKQVQRFSVVTNLKPQTEVNVNTTIENPYVLGLIRGRQQFHQNNDYVGILTYAIAHAHFITPVHFDKKPVDNGDGTSTIREQSNMQFIFLQNPQEASQRDFPVFTDWRALNQWKEAFASESDKQILILRFPDCVSLLSNSKANLVINPFDSSAALLSSAMIDQIIHLDAYEQEFGKAQTAGASAPAP